jgi:heme/copper-type cytochrome/quinol oxidase subunit 2
MLINIILLFLVFGASKAKISPYAAAALFGVVKGVIYYFLSQSILYAFISCIISGGLAAGFVYFLARLDKNESTVDPYPKYGTRKKTRFQWEYIPAAGIAILLIFGS